MALNKKQIAAKFLPNVINNRLKTITWQDVENAIAALDQQDKARIANKLAKKDFASVGRILFQVVLKEIKIDSEMLVEAMFEDNRLNLNELEQLLS
jgi:3-hydroxyacyl-CoA dehydrogenase